MKKLIHKIKIKVLCLLGFALDIHSKGKWPSYALSNFHPHSFEFDGVQCESMEGFLQSLKTNDKERQVLVCALSKKEAKQRSTDTWKKEQNIYWNGKVYNRHGYQFQFLIRRAYRAMLNQCPKFRDALVETKEKRLYHSIGNPDAYDTILTERELCTILTELRRELK